ncbi:hypothetical protein AVEN_138106-1 [Araneus ventricosus]|uniref:Reverse transcriptase domain-containing protein n=1 Tax=Araneus ventricosus TaxID=182803 RepID=A0A4Y2QIL1_ARAVE|nr:hypothetical protein AVEN_138106-1 [Araneus ventricosus]
MIQVESPGKDPRRCKDYRLLNANARTQFFPLPKIKEHIEKVAAAKYITVVGLAKGMPFGHMTVPYSLSKLMTQVLENCDTFAVPYLDDIAFLSDSWEDLLKHVDEVLKRIGDARLTIKHSKSALTQSLKAKVKKEKINWTKECNQALTELKNRLTEMPLLYAPDYRREITVQTDASDLGIGIVLSQRENKNVENPVLYLSKKFTDAQKKYGTTEKECAAKIYAIKKLKKIKNYPYYDEEFAKGQLEVIAQKREAEAELARKERKTERIYELEKLKIASAAETAILNSTRSEMSRNRLEIKHLKQNFDSQNTDISLYLTLFERHARAAGVEEEECVSQLISLLPLELAQIIIKEPEEQMRENTNVKNVSLDRFIMKPETFRVKFTQH